MEKTQKTKLLKYCQELYKKISEYDSQSFVSFLATTSKHYYQQLQDKEAYYKFLFYANKQKSNPIDKEKAKDRSYEKFIHEILGIKMQADAITIQDKMFEELSMQEIAYTFGWLRRIVDSKVDKNESKGKIEKKSKERKKYSHNENRQIVDEANPFNIVSQLFSNDKK